MKRRVHYLVIYIYSFMLLDVKTTFICLDFIDFKVVINLFHITNILNETRKNHCILRLKCLADINNNIEVLIISCGNIEENTCEHI